MSGDITGKKLELEMQNGAKATIDVTSGVMIDAVNVVSADIFTSNGAIHVIDEVILPN